MKRHKKICSISILMRAYVQTESEKSFVLKMHGWKWMYTYAIKIKLWGTFGLKSGGWIREIKKNIHSMAHISTCKLLTNIFRGFELEVQQDTICFFQTNLIDICNKTHIALNYVVSAQRYMHADVCICVYLFMRLCILSKNHSF